MRRGIPIEQYPVKGTVNAGIQYGIEFAELEACVAAGLDLWQWESGVYPIAFKNRIIAWHRLHALVSLHTAMATRPPEKPGSKSKRRPSRRR